MRTFLSLYWDISRKGTTHGTNKNYSLEYAGYGVAMEMHLGKTVADAMIHDTIEEHPFA